MTSDLADSANSDPTSADSLLTHLPSQDGPEALDAGWANQPSLAEHPRGSRLISRLLPPAIRLWLHTQLDHLEGLDFRLEGGDRQILSGYVPQVRLAAQAAVYQGLQVSQVTVAASEIRINLGQVLRGKPLRLLQPFPVAGQICLSKDDLRASLLAPLLAQGLEDVLHRLMQAQPESRSAMEAIPNLATFCQSATVTDLALGDGHLQLTWQSNDPAQPNQNPCLTLHTDLEIRDGRWLCLCQSAFKLQQGESWSAPVALEEVVMDLGPEVNIQRLVVTTSGIEVDGVVRVIPAD
jgi:hypothetical protein